MKEEEIEQRKLVQFLKQNKIFYFAPMNENSHSGKDRKLAAILENKAKAMGKVNGVTDIVVLLTETALFIEMKAKTGKVSENQKNFIERLKTLNYAHGYICYSYEEAKDKILMHMSYNNSKDLSR